MVVVKHFSENKYFSKRKIFSSVWLHYENCCRKYFHVFGSILKMLFSYKFFKVSQHLNKFHYRKFQNHNHNHKFFKVSRLFSQLHYHTTTTTTKIKITERDRWVEGEIVRRRDRAEVRSKARSSGAVRSVRYCGRRGAISEIWCVRLLDWSSGFAGDVECVIWALSLSLSARLTRKWFEVKI